MGFRINTNILSLSAQRSLSKTTKAFQRSLERLASGQRINRAGDDAAGLAISEGLESQIRGVRRGIRNMNDANGYLSVAAGAIQTQLEIVQRMRELAIQSANGSISARDRGYLDTEFQELFSEYQRITESTEFNGQQILKGDSTFSIQIGSRKTNTIEIEASNTSFQNIFLVEKPTGNYQTKGSDFETGANPEDFGINIESGDFNNDGIADVFGHGYKGGNLFTFNLGNGDGTFYETDTAGPSSAGVHRRITAVIEDFDKDGNNDIVIGGTTADSWTIMFGNGDGTFEAQVDIASDDRPHDIESADLNNDEHLDLVVYDADPGEVDVYFGNGDGSFETAVSYDAGSSNFLSAMPEALELIDLDGDRQLDLIYTNEADNTLSWRMNQGDGSFGSAESLSIDQTYGRDLLIQDIDGDGIDEIILHHANRAESTFNEQTLIRNDGDGNLSFESLGGGLLGQDIETGDFDTDGILDLATYGDGSLYIRYGNGDGSFSSATSQSFDVPTDGGDVSKNLEITDINGDGFDDFIVPQHTLEQIFALITLTEERYDPTAMNLRSQESSQDILQILDNALLNLSERLGEIGATSNRLEFALNNNQNLLENLSSARSQLLDADIAVEASDLSRAQILQQAGISVMSQANIAPRLALELLDF